jgi:two-component system cell cycle response regulator CtrA
VDGREALDEIETRGRDFQVFLLDCTMPKLTGVELYREIRTSGLKTPVILISGYHEGLALDEIRSDPAAQFLRKPFSVDQLLEVVRALPVTQPQTN